jgi:hypothetical protein
MKPSQSNENVARVFTRFINRRVRLITTDGEIILTTIYRIDPECGCVTHELETTNHPQKYRRMGRVNPQGMYAVPFEQISAIEVQETDESAPRRWKAQ